MNTDQPTLGPAIAMLAIYYAVQSALIAPFVFGSLIVHQTFAVNLGAMALANSLALLPTIWLGTVICQRSWRDLVTFGAMPWRLIPAVVLMASGSYLLCSEVDNMTRMVLPMPKMVAEVLRNVFDAARQPVGAALALVVVAPLAEELLCRRWVLGSMLRKWSPATAILGSGLVFGLIHMNPWQFFYATALGFLLGWLYWRTRSLGLCVFVHALNNGLSWAFTFFQTDIPGLTGDNDQPAQFQPWWLDLTAAVVFALGLWLCWRQTPAPRPEVARLEAPPVIPLP